MIQGTAGKGGQGGQRRAASVRRRAELPGLGGMRLLEEEVRVGVSM